MMISLPRTSRSLLVALVGSILMVVSAAVTSARNSGRTSSSSSSNRSSGRPLDGAEAEVSSTEVLPAAIATWRFGKIAVDAAAELLADGGTALDATEAGRKDTAVVVGCTCLVLQWCLNMCGWPHLKLFFVAPKPQ